MKSNPFVHFFGALVGMTAIGCIGLLSGSKAPERQVFDCEVAALEPYVGEVLDAEELVRDAYKGQADLVHALRWLGLKPAQIKAAADALNDCAKPAPAELPDAGLSGS